MPKAGNIPGKTKAAPAFQVAPAEHQVALSDLKEKIERFINDPVSPLSIPLTDDEVLALPNLTLTVGAIDPRQNYSVTKSYDKQSFFLSNLQLNKARY